MEHDSPKLLFRLACEYLSSGRVVRPGVVHAARACRHRADPGAGGDVDAGGHLLTSSDVRELDALLVVDPELGRTPLTWLGTGPTARARRR